MKYGSPYAKTPHCRPKQSGGFIYLFRLSVMYLATTPAITDKINVTTNERIVNSICTPPYIHRKCNKYLYI